MKRFLSMLVITIAVYHAGLTQNVSINANGYPPDPSAILDVSSTDKGVLVPRMAGFQRAMIISPAQGLLVYDTDSRSFWFYEDGWKELGSGGMPSGPASGDLADNYPSPRVAKIQNLDVAFGVPFDKQVLKWDALSNNWKGRNDSLFLPYNVAFGSATKLFGIQNNNTTAGSSAIFGRSGNVGSGINPGFTMAVWGDNANGQGVTGTSAQGNGLFGSSIYNHGIVGYSGNLGFAGVYGATQDYGIIGILGEVLEGGGDAVVGRNLSGSGKAGIFTSPYPEHIDTTLSTSTHGTGILSSFNVTNETNAKPAIDVSHAGSGAGVKVRLPRTSSAGNGIDAIVEGSGTAIYGKSGKGIAGKFENTNADNSYPPLLVSNQGFGTSLYVGALHNGTTGPAIDVFNLGSGGGVNVFSEKGKAGIFTTSGATGTVENMIATTDANASNAVFNSNHPTSLQPGILVNQEGKGNGVRIDLTNPTNTFAGLYLHTEGNRGVDVISKGVFGITASAQANNAVAISANTGQTANNAIAVKGSTGANVTNGIGVLGQAGINDPNGIGVKGIAGGGIVGGVGVLGETSSNAPQAIAVKGVGYSHDEDFGAVTGINMVDGVGVYGEALGLDGIGVAGTVGNNNQHAVAGVFRNKYTENNRSVVEIITNGKGNGILIDHNHLTSTSPLIRMTNSGNGQFLRLESGLGDIKTTISKEGNLTTDGTITVKGDKGVVRNSSSTQLRMQIMSVSFPGGSISKFDEFNAPLVVDVTFSPAFSSAPAVSLANVVSGGFGLLTPSIYDVTTDSFKFQLFNYTGHDWNYPATTLKFVLIGAE